MGQPKLGSSFNTSQSKFKIPHQIWQNTIKPAPNKIGSEGSERVTSWNQSIAIPILEWSSTHMFHVVLHGKASFMWLFYLVISKRILTSLPSCVKHVNNLTMTRWAVWIYEYYLRAWFETIIKVVLMRPYGVTINIVIFDFTGYESNVKIRDLR